MRQVTLRLAADVERPVVIVGGNMTALLDTGAYIPVWTDEESILTEKLGAILQKKPISPPSLPMAKSEQMRYNDSSKAEGLRKAAYASFRI